MGGSWSPSYETSWWRFDYSPTSGSCLPVAAPRGGSGGFTPHPGAGPGSPRPPGKKSITAAGRAGLGMRTRAGGGREGNRAPRPYSAPGRGLRALICAEPRLSKSAAAAEMLRNDLSIAPSLVTATKQDRVLLVLHQQL